MSKGSKKYQLFAYLALAATLIALLGTILVFYFAYSSPDTFETYPKYAYSEYVDKTDSGEINARDGAQLLEAESFALSGEAEREENIGASAQEAVTDLSRASSLSYTLQASASMNVKLTLSISYSSNNGKSIAASSLFSLFLDGSEISLIGVEVPPSYNNMEFLEVDLSTLSLRSGTNLIVLLSRSNADYSIDYFLFTPAEERTSSAEEIGHASETTFYANSGEQLFEAELGERTGTLLLSSEEASNACFAYFTEAGDTLTLALDSSAQVSTTLSLYLSRVSGDTDEVSFRFLLNGKEIFSGGQDLFGDTFTLVSLGTISFQRGENVLTLIDDTGQFYFDYWLISENINYLSSNPNNRYEAEEAYSEQTETLESEEAFAGKYVRPLASSAIVEFDINTLLSDRTYAAIRIGYQGDEVSLANHLSISLNGKALSLSSLYLTASTDEETFQDISLGSIDLKSGRNVIQITFLSTDCRLDALILYYPILERNTQLSFYAAELVSPRDGRVYFSKGASKKKALLLEDTSLSIYFASNRETTLNLMIAPYFLSGGESLSDCLTVSLNGVALDLKDATRPATESVSSYPSLNLGNVTAEPGLNVLTITSTDSSFLLDTISLNE